MPKLSAKCSICKLPADQREAFHTDKWIHHATGAQLAAKYFPGRREGSVQKACSVHFKDHMPFDDFVNGMMERQSLPKVATSDSVAPLTQGERSIFIESYREKIDSLHTMESMMRTLMDRANYLNKEWEKIHVATKCEKCGRDDTGPNLVKILAVFRELREQADAWTKLRNPAGIINKIAERTFVTFVEEMTDLYVLTLNEKSRLIRDTANEFLAGKINQAVFAKRITETLDDFGGDKISEAAQEKYQRILTSAVKELKL